MGEGSGPGEATFRLMYRSRNLMPAATYRADLGRLFSAARSDNKAADVTGALLLSGGSFVQVLEGVEDVVRPLFERISADPRHDEVELIDARAVARREFGRWAMAYVLHDGDVPLIAHSDGIAPAAGRPTTAGQRQLLDAMRSSVARSHQP